VTNDRLNDNAVVEILVVASPRYVLRTMTLYPIISDKRSYFYSASHTSGS
jgi:hypothetical protein